MTLDTLFFDTYYLSEIYNRVIAGENPDVTKLRSAANTYDTMLQYILWARLALVTRRNPRYDLLLREQHGHEELCDGVTVADYIGDMPFGVINRGFRKILKNASFPCPVKLVLGFYYDPRMGAPAINQHSSGYAIDIIPADEEETDMVKVARAIKLTGNNSVMAIPMPNYIHVGRKINRKAPKHKTSVNCIGLADANKMRGQFTPIGWITNSEFGSSCNPSLSTSNYHLLISNH